MRRRFPLLSAVVLLSVVVACSPSATDGLSYQDVDGSVLRDSLMVVATSRQDTTTEGMLGSTIIVDANGKGRRIDNDGMDTVRLDYRDGVLGFADLRHDYLLGTDQPVRRRTKAPDTLYGSHLLDGGERLVSLFNDGFGDDGYRMVVTDPGSVGAPREERGYVLSTALCGKAVWAVVSPDLQEVSPTSSLAVRRIVPRGGAAWTIEGGSGVTDLSLADAACEGGRLVAVGEVTDQAERSRPVVAAVDLATGRSSLVDMTGPDTGASVDPRDSWRFKAITVRDDQVYAVAQPATSATDSAQLWRVEPATGRKTKVTGLRGSDDSSELLFHFDGDQLYVLDSTAGEPSGLTAIDVQDGAVRDRRTIDSVEDQVNGRLTSFEEAQVVRDFVVLTPVDRW